MTSGVRLIVFVVFGQSIVLMDKFASHQLVTGAAATRRELRLRLRLRRCVSQPMAAGPPPWF